MTRQEYENMLDEINIKIADLEYKKGNYLSSSTMDESIKNDGINSLDKKISLLKREKFELEDKYNYQKQQEKENFEQKRNTQVLDVNVDSYAKREKMKIDYVKAFPDTQLARDLMDGKEVDFKEIITALKEHKASLAEDKAKKAGQADEKINPATAEDMPKNDEEAAAFTAQVIDEMNRAIEEQKANDKQKQLNDASQDIENTMVMDSIIASKQAENGQNDVEFNVEQHNEKDEPEVVEGENKGRQLVKKISEAPGIIKEKLTANNKNALKAIALIVAAGAIVLTAGAALGVAPTAVAAAGVAGYGAHEFIKGRKGLK